MFARLKETIRILTYRPEPEHTPDVVIVEKRPQGKPPVFGKVVAFLVEGFVCFYCVGYIAGHLGGALFHLHPTKTVSFGTIVGALGALLLWLGHSLITEVQVLLKRRLNLIDRLAPYFGYKVEETYRSIKG